MNIFYRKIRTVSIKIVPPVRLEGLGLNLSDAVNMFLRQVILQNGIPFEVKYPEDTLEFKPEVIEAMKEAKQISRDPNTKRYSSFSEALKDMDL